MILQLAIRLTFLVYSFLYRFLQCQFIAIAIVRHTVLAGSGATVAVAAIADAARTITHSSHPVNRNGNRIFEITIFSIVVLLPVDSCRSAIVICVCVVAIVIAAKVMQSNKSRRIMHIDGIRIMESHI